MKLLQVESTTYYNVLLLVWERNFLEAKKNLRN